MNIYITSEANAKLWAYIEAVNTEIGGWGYAFMTDDGDFVWSDTFLVPQVSTMSEVDFDSTGGDAAAIERAAQDDVLGKDGFVWVSWHSHHTMQSYWSSTDDKRIESLRIAGIPSLISLVGNHEHKYKCRWDAFNVKHSNIVIPQITMDNLKLTLDPADELFKQVYADIDANLRKPAVKPAVGWTKSKKPLGQPKGGTKSKPKTDAELEAELGMTLEEAFEIKEWMDEGLSYDDAREIVLKEIGTEYIVGPEGVVEAQGGNFDSMAWGDEITDDEVKQLTEANTGATN